MSDPIPQTLRLRCPGCGESRPLEGPCAECGCSPPDRFDLSKRASARLKSVAVPLLLAVGLMLLLLTTGGVAGLLGGAVMAVVVGFIVLTFRSGPEVWIVHAHGHGLGVGGAVFATVQVAKGAVVSTLLNDLREVPLTADVSALAGCSDDSLSAALEDIVDVAEHIEFALPWLMALARCARGELEVREVHSPSSSAEQGELVDLYVVGQPDWFDAQAGAWMHVGDASNEEQVRIVREWVEGEPRWKALLTSFD